MANTITTAQANAIEAIADRRIAAIEAGNGSNKARALDYHRSVKWAAVSASTCPDSYAELVDLIGDDETYSRPAESYVPAQVAA